MIQEVPKIFQPVVRTEYPPQNKIPFEEYFMGYFNKWSIGIARTYLPVMWTTFYISRKYGTANMMDLQKFLDRLDRNKKYFTVIQYDDGILQDLKDLDILIFGAGGGGKKTLSERNLGIPIPLLCQPSLFIDKSKNRDLLCSFAGTIKNHPIRQQIKNLYFNKFLVLDSVGYDQYISIMERSIFSLCPRGYGATSFRICESLQHGSIPVYVYDKPWIPFQDKFDFNEIGILVSEKQIPDILNIIKSKTKEDIEKYIDNGKRIYEEFFTFEGCAKTIISKL
jgi:hypothetical protein